MTLNNYFTHRCLPAVFRKKNYFDIFYQNILLYPDRLQGFLIDALKIATQSAGEDVETPFEVELFKISLYGTIEKGIICIDMPTWGRTRDCVAIAFPTNPNKAGYYTCEYSVSPFDNSEHFFLGQWATDCGEVQHNNWGEINPADSDNFMKMLYGIAYNQ